MPANRETPPDVAFGSISGLKFLIFYKNLDLEFSEVLEIHFISGGYAARSRLGQVVISLINQTDYKARDLEALKLGFLTKHLREVKERNEPVFRQYRRKLLETRKAAEFYGIRQEINTAASLSRKGVRFETPDPPDFSIEHEGQKVHIECTSAHVLQKKEQSLVYKVKAALKKKMSNPYATPDTALFLDATNLLFNSGDEDGFLSELEPEMRAVLSDNSFGNVTVFFTMFDRQEEEIQSGFKR